MHKDVNNRFIVRCLRNISMPYKSCFNFPCCHVLSRQSRNGTDAECERGLGFLVRKGSQVINS